MQHHLEHGTHLDKLNNVVLCVEQNDAVIIARLLVVAIKQIHFFIFCKKLNKDSATMMCIR